MRYITLAAVTGLALGVAVTAHAGNDPSLSGPARTIYSEAQPNVSSKPNSVTEGSAELLSALLAEWDQAAFNPPGKPGQSRVYGRPGYVTTGGGYNYMVVLIRSAATDVEAGRYQDAAPKIAKARDLLAASNLRKG
jgi:hypothetical protein